jgi:subtilisin family serine protease
VLAAVLAAGALPAGATDPAVTSQWAVVRSADGSVRVVKGLEAVSATAMNARTGRTGDRVLSVEQDQPVKATGGDPMRPQQWALNKASYEYSWRASNGNGVKVAVIDTGVAASHQDLAGSVVPGTDLASDKPQVDPSGTGMVDPAGHGTHVAGIIAAHVNNGVGIAGAAPGAKIMPVRVLDKNGTGVASNVALGIIWAADHGARVINLSLGGGESAGEQQALQYAAAKNVIVFAAAGNSYESGNLPSYPAAYPEAVAVAAVNSSLQHASFSNSGSYVDIAAPGDSILSTYGGSKANDYEWMSGTSMASPYAAAEAAIVIGENPSLSATRVRQVIESSAKYLGNPSFFGHGLVNPSAAVVSALPGLNNGTEGHGYWVVGIDGSVRTFGSARFYGDLRHRAHSGTVVAGARTPNGGGYWLATSTGAVYSFGNAGYYGSMYGARLKGSIVGMTPTPSGRGYILLGNDGGIFTFGDARFKGSTGGMRLNARVLDMTMTNNGGGYWFVAGDGGVFTFGNATFRGSTGAMRLAQPVASMTASANGSGYWLVAQDGGIFAFNVPFKGSLPTYERMIGKQAATVRMRALPSNNGYYMLGVDGHVYAFASAKNWGSATGLWSVDLMLAP